MSRYLKRFTKKKKSNSRTNSVPEATTVEHGFVDNVGGINFPTSPNADNLPPRQYDESSELKVFWSQPRYGGNVNKINPIFINEPAELYEAAFIPPDNAHDFSALPRYRVNDRHSLYDDSFGVAPDDSESGMYRSRSLGAIPSYTQDNDGLNLAEVKKQRRDKEPSSSSGRGRLFGLFKNEDSDEEDTPKAEATSRSMERDSGVYPAFDHEDEEEPIEELLARKLGAFKSDESDNNTQYNEDLLSQTMKESDLIISALESSRNDLSRVGIDDNETNRESISYWASSESINDERNRRRSTVLLSANEDLFVAKNESVNEDRVFAHEQRSVQASNDSIDSFFSDDDENYSQNHIQRIPKGSFIRSKSVPDFNGLFQNDNDLPTASRLRANTSTQEEDFNSMEKTLNDLESHLTDVLETNPNASFQQQQGAHHQQKDPLALREKQIFTKSSPTLTSVPRGRVSSVKLSLEQSQSRSKSVSNLSITEQYDSDESDGPYGRTNNRLKAAASFGAIDPGSLSPLLANRKYFGDAILNKMKERRSKNEVLTSNDGTFRTVKSIDESDDDSELVSNNNGITRTFSTNSSSKTILVEAPVSNVTSVRLKVENVRKKDRSSQENLQKQQGQSQWQRHQQNSQQQQYQQLYQQKYQQQQQQKRQPTISTSGNNIQIVEEEHVQETRVEELNSQIRNSSPSMYMDVGGNANTVTGTGVAIFDTRTREPPVVKKKPTIQSILKAIGRVELPEFLEDEEVYPDRACKRTIMQLPVRCYNFGSDCEWSGELNNLQDHLEKCQLVAVSCVNSCGRTDISRNQMSQHIEADGDCPLAVVMCRYNDVGCKFKARRVDIELHLQESLEQHLDLAHSKIRELEVRQENICMNGKFLWKISNYDHLVKQSATKKDKEKLCSPPFYTGQYGYKLRAEAFLNGLGQGKGSHLSLYVVIMKGEYDAILPWPFKQNVDFVLIDQDDEKANRQNKVWKLSCERNSDYFQRPNKAKSLGFGCPKFVSLETLKTRNYIRDQTLFIKIEVEPTDHLIFAPAPTH